MPLEYKKLKGKKKFKRLFANGIFYRGDQIFLKSFADCYSGKESEESGWAFCPSRTLGGAVVRNRHRRLCREALQSIMRNSISFHPCHSIALLPQRGFVRLTCKEREYSLLRLLQRTGLIKN